MRGKSIAVYWPWNALITCCLELGVVKSCSVSHRTCFFTPPSCSSHGYLWFNCLTKVFLPLRMKDLASELFFWQSALWKRVVAVFAGIDMARSHIPGKSLGDAVGILHLLCSPQEESPSRAQSQGRRLVSGAWLSHSCHKAELGTYKVPRASSQPQKHQPVVQLWPVHAHSLPSPHSTFTVFSQGERVSGSLGFIYFGVALNPRQVWRETWSCIQCYLSS